ncbi:Uncharacterised protein [Mycobacteroides abscessus subsp. massiliense]|nr:Uncharacterised protein [Mycobacteroides abscessus subsp. massiliense]
MNTDDLRASGDCGQSGCDAAVYAFGGILFACQLADHTFARYADQEWESGCVHQFRQMLYQGNVVLQVFAETEAGVERDAFRGNACSNAFCRACF